MANNSKLADADDKIKLAVDLIYLIEINNIDTDTALEALAIVTQDLKKKQQAQQIAKKKADGDPSAS
ncbi:MAG: DUF2496 domain-containing protein [Vibrionaceae bacterium]